MPQQDRHHATQEEHPTYPNKTFDSNESLPTSGTKSDQRETHTPPTLPKTRTSVQRTGSTAIPRTASMGLRHRTQKGRSQHSTRQSILPHTAGTGRSPRLPQGTPGERIYPTIKKPLCRPVLLYQKERWEVAPGPRLPKGKQMDHQEPLPAPPHPGAHQSSERSNPLLKIRHSVGLQQCADQRGRQMESGLCNEPRTL